jgi:class 3 adenylate cyclase
MAEERVQRRLTAILAADVVGYSRMMGTDEASTLAWLKDCREKTLSSGSESHLRCRIDNSIITALKELVPIARII